MSNLHDHVVIVTGSTSGIGKGLARYLHTQGCQVVLNGLGKPDEIKRLQSEMKAAYHAADMTKPDEIADLIATVKRDYGRVDGLVNNAGVQHVAPVDRFETEAWDKVIAINLSACFHAIKAVVPVMRAQGRGRIVSIASAHGLVASPFKSAYVAAKHGLLGLSKSVALEVAEDNITVNTICPGYVKTPLVEGQITAQAEARNLDEETVMRDIILAAQPTKRFVEIDEIGGMLAYLLSDAGASVNGAALSIDGGWTAK